jgi:hypothetical protein
MRNRSLSIQSNNARQVAMSLQRLAAELQFRVVEGLHDRVIFRELFPIGLTALDPIETAVQNQTLTSSQLSGRKEIDTLVQPCACRCINGAYHISKRGIAGTRASRIIIAIWRRAATSVLHP